MKIYLDIIRFNFLKYLTYPLEIVGLVSFKLLTLVVLILFWSIVSNTSDLSLSPKELASYFLIATTVGEIIMLYPLAFGKKLEKTIKSGAITQYLIKPISTVPYLYAATLGENGLNILLSLIGLIVGATLINALSLVSIFLFLAFLLCSIILSIAFSMIIGVMAMYIIEVEGFRNAIIHVLKVLSGSLIPISLFPHTLQSILLLSPFPYLVYGPVNALKQGYTSQTVLHLSIAMIWSLLMILISSLLWRHSLKKYEAIGI